MVSGKNERTWVLSVSEGLIRGLILSSAIFVAMVLFLLGYFPGGTVHVALLVFSSATLAFGLYHLSRKWSLFATMEARETSLFAVGVIVLFLAPLRPGHSIRSASDLGSGDMMAWMAVGWTFVALSSALLARKAGFFGPWLLGIAALSIVAWHHGPATGVEYTFRDRVYITMSLALLVIGAALHMYHLYLRTRVHRAIGLRVSGRAREALRIYDAVLRVNPYDEVLWNNKANVLADLGRHDEAVASYGRALSINPFYKVAADNLKQVRRWRMDSASGRGPSFRDRGERFILLWRRKVCYQSGWFFGTLVALTFTIHIQTGEGAALSLMGRPVSAEPVIDAIIVFVMGLFVWNRLVRTMVHKGTVHRVRGELKEALALYDMAVRMNPFNDIAWNNRGNVLTSMGRYAEALESYDRALRLYPSQPAATANSGILQRGKVGERFNPRLVRSQLRRGFAGRPGRVA